MQMGIIAHLRGLRNKEIKLLYWLLAARNMLLPYSISRETAKEGNNGGNKDNNI